MKCFEEFFPIDGNIVVHFHHKSCVATETEEGQSNITIGDITMGDITIGDTTIGDITIGDISTYVRILDKGFFQFFHTFSSLSFFTL